MQSCRAQRPVLLPAAGTFLSVSLIPRGTGTDLPERSSLSGRNSCRHSKGSSRALLRQDQTCSAFPPSHLCSPHAGLRLKEARSTQGCSAEFGFVIPEEPKASQSWASPGHSVFRVTASTKGKASPGASQRTSRGLALPALLGFSWCCPNIDCAQGPLK